MAGILKQQAKRVAAFGAIVSLGGCALFNPYQVDPQLQSDINDWQHRDPQAKFAGDIDAAIDAANQQRQKYVDALGARAQFQNITGTALFGLTALTVYKGLASDTQATKRLVAMGGTGAAAGYGLWTFIGNKGAEKAYLSGYKAITCAILKVRPALVPMNQYVTWKSEVDKLEEDIRELDGLLVTLQTQRDLEIESGINEDAVHSRLDHEFRLHYSALAKARELLNNANTFQRLVDTGGFALRRRVELIVEGVSESIQGSENDIPKLDGMLSNYTSITKAFASVKPVPQADPTQSDSTSPPATGASGATGSNGAASASAPATTDAAKSTALEAKAAKSKQKAVDAKTAADKAAADSASAPGNADLAKAAKDAAAGKAKADKTAAADKKAAIDAKTKPAANAQTTSPVSTAQSPAGKAVDDEAAKVAALQADTKSLDSKLNSLTADVRNIQEAERQQVQGKTPKEFVTTPEREKLGTWLSKIYAQQRKVNDLLGAVHAAYRSDKNTPECADPSQGTLAVSIADDSISIPAGSSYDFTVDGGFSATGGPTATIQGAKSGGDGGNDPTVTLTKSDHSKTYWTIKVPAKATQPSKVELVVTDSAGRLSEQITVNIMVAPKS